LSQTIIRATVRHEGELYDPSAIVLSDITGTWGVRRTDTGATVVAAGTALARVSTGEYSYTFTDPAPGLSYEYVIASTIEGVVYRHTGTATGGAAGLGELSTLDSRVRVHCGNAPLALIHQVERIIFRDFCMETEAWEHTVTQDTVADQAAYDLGLPDDTVLERLLSVTIEDIAVAVKRLLPSENGITFETAPTASGDSLEVKCVVVPTLSCSRAPSWLLDRYADGLVAGVVAYLKGMGGKPWFAPKEIDWHLSQFRTAVGRAHVERITGRGWNPRMKIPVLT